MTKAQEREAAALRRAQAHAASPDAGEHLATTFLDAGLVPAPGSTVSGYWPIRTEIDPRPLMRALAERGCRIALPVTPPRGVEAPLVFRLWREADILTPAAFALHEPAAESSEVDPDLVLAPLLAFDRSGCRLGYGKGHYDRTLAALRRRKPVTLIGLAFAAQEAPHMRCEPHDVRLDGIATEIGYIPVMDTQT